MCECVHMSVEAKFSQLVSWRMLVKPPKYTFRGLTSFFKTCHSFPKRS